MADSTLQETLLNKIPADLLDKISTGPRDIYEKVHQRELLLIEQIKHFANIRVEELANFGRNLLEQRKYEQTMKERQESMTESRPVLKSIVKREPSTMEKRVSFSELPPEVEEFYSHEEDVSDTDSDTVNYEHRYNKTIESSSEEDEEEADEENFDNNVLEPVGNNASPPLDDSPRIESSVPPSPAVSPEPIDLHRYDWTPGDEEPAISFEDAYNLPATDDESEVPDLDNSIITTTPSPPKPHGFVGSAPINIDMDTLMRGHYQPEVASTLDRASALNPENMSFSQRMAWEERPRATGTSS